VKALSVISKSLSEVMDSTESRAVLTGWAKNANPEILSLLLKNENLSSQVFEEAYSNLSEEDKLKFLRNDDSLRSSKLAYTLRSLVDPNLRYQSDPSAWRAVVTARANAVLDREVWSEDDVQVAEKTLGSSGVVLKLKKDFESGTRTVWPLAKHQEKLELGLAGRNTFGYSYQLAVFAEHSTNPIILANLGSFRPAMVDRVLANPNTDMKALASILVKNDKLSADQFNKAKSLLLAHPDTPASVKASLVSSSSASAPVFNEAEKTDLFKEAKIAKRVSLASRKSALAYPSLAAISREREAEALLRYDVARGKLDATEQNFVALGKQKAYLEKNVVYDLDTNKSYKSVLKRIENANKFRVQNGDHDGLLETLKPLAYTIYNPFKG
jgi:hypothetical protein